MTRAYSDDLRWRIVWLHHFLDISADEVARIMQVSERSVYRFTKRFISTGEVRKTIQRNGPLPILSELEESHLIHLVLTRPGIYLRELQQELMQYSGCTVHASTICRVMKRVGITRQRIKHVSLQRSEIRRAVFAAEMEMFDLPMLLWIDETGCDLRNALRKYGYGIRGLPPQDHCLVLRGKRHSAIGILSSDGLEDIFITDGTVDGDMFMHFVMHNLLPILQPFDGFNEKSVVIMDNAAIHHIDPVIAAINSVGALVWFLPPYSPDMNPIESVFSEVKHYLQANNLLFNTTLSTDTILLMAFNSVSEDNCLSYIEYAGYS